MIGRILPSVIQHLRTRPLTPFSFFCSQKPSPKQPLCEYNQKIVWNWAIIKHILEAPPFKQTDSSSLRKSIIDLKLPQNAQKYVFCPNLRKQAIKPFEEGLVLNKFVSNQQELLDTNENDTPFIFSPNVVTQKVFDHLYYGSFCNKLLLTGGGRIEKTASIILFVHLTNEIHKSFFQVLKSEQKEKELQQLWSEKLVCHPTIPRFFYWDTQVQNLQGPSYIEKLILQQSSYLSEEQKNKLRQAKNLSEFKQNYKAFHHKQTNFRVIVDQIDQMVQQIKTDNKILSQQKIEDRIKYINACPTKKWLELYNQLVNFGNGYILSSSKDIDKQIIYKQSDKLNLTLGISEQDKLIVQSVPFQHSQVSRQQIDNCYLFWLQFKKQLRALKAEPSKNILPLIYKKTLKKFGNIKFKGVQSLEYFNYHIKEYCSFIQYILNQSNIQQEQKFGQIQNIVEDSVAKGFEKHCIAVERLINIANYWDEINDNKKRIIQILHIKASKNISNYKAQQLLQFDLDIFNKDDILNNVNVKKMLQQDTALKQFLPFQIKGSTLRLNWTNSQFYTLFFFTIYPYMEQPFGTQTTREMEGIIFYEGLGDLIFRFNYKGGIKEYNQKKKSWKMLMPMPISGKPQIDYLFGTDNKYRRRLLHMKTFNQYFEQDSQDFK